MKSKLIIFLAFFNGFLMLHSISCTPEPEPIRFGEDLCAYCKMMISDKRFGAELVTHKGKLQKFDSAECLAAWHLGGQTPQEDIHSLWVVDFSRPEQLIDATQAVYLQSKDLHSPMSLNISAFSDRATADKVQRLYIGELIDWNTVRNIVNENWLQEK